jgi:hypothetical protein
VCGLPSYHDTTARGRLGHLGHSNDVIIDLKVVIVVKGLKKGSHHSFASILLYLYGDDDDDDTSRILRGW